MAEPHCRSRLIGSEIHTSVNIIRNNKVKWLEVNDIVSDINYGASTLHGRISKFHPHALSL